MVNHHHLAIHLLLHRQLKRLSGGACQQWTSVTCYISGTIKPSRCFSRLIVPIDHRISCGLSHTPLWKESSGALYDFSPGIISLKGVWNSAAYILGTPLTPRLSGDMMPSYLLAGVPVTNLMRNLTTGSTLLLLFSHPEIKLLLIILYNLYMITIINSACQVLFRFIINFF